MAERYKITTVVNITLRDEDYMDTVLKIDEPRNDITKAEIESAFENVLDQKLLYSRSGRLITTIVGAASVKTTILETDIE